MSKKYYHSRKQTKTLLSDNHVVNDIRALNVQPRGMLMNRGIVRRVHKCDSLLSKVLYWYEFVLLLSLLNCTAWFVGLSTKVQGLLKIKIFNFKHKSSNTRSKIEFWLAINHKDDIYVLVATTTCSCSQWMSEGCWKTTVRWTQINPILYSWKWIF